MISPFLAEILSGWNAYDVRAKFNRDRTSADRDVPLGTPPAEKFQVLAKKFCRVSSREPNRQLSGYCDYGPSRATVLPSLRGLLDPCAASRRRGTAHVPVLRM